MARWQISPGIARSLSRLCPPHLRQSFPCRYWTLKSIAFSSSFAASYAVSVRQASVLLTASSGFHLAMDTLAVRLTIPPAGFVEDFHLQMNAPCRAHNRKAEWETRPVCGDGQRVKRLGCSLVSSGLMSYARKFSAFAAVAHALDFFVRLHLRELHPLRVENYRVRQSPDQTDNPRRARPKQQVKLAEAKIIFPGYWHNTANQLQQEQPDGEDERIFAELDEAYGDEHEEGEHTPPRNGPERPVA